MSLLPGSTEFDPTNRGIRSRILTFRTMEVGQDTITAAGRIFLGRVTQPGWILDTVEMFTAAAIPASATDYWTFRPLSIEGVRNGTTRILDPGLSSLTRNINGNVGDLLQVPKSIGYKVPVNAILAVDILATGSPTQIIKPTFQATLSFGG